MDLLAGYGSDSSNDSSEAAALPSSRSKSTAATTTGTAQLSSSTKYSAAATSTKKTSLSRRGRKLVSLHAVLPQHILDQLIKSEAQGWEGSDNEDQNMGQSKPSKPIGATKQQTQQQQPRDVGIFSFLSELKSAATATTTTTAEKPERKMPPAVAPEPRFVEPEPTLKNNTNNLQQETMGKTEHDNNDNCTEQEPVAQKFVFKRPSHIVSAPRVFPNETKMDTDRLTNDKWSMNTRQEKLNQTSIRLPNSSLGVASHTATVTAAPSQQQPQPPAPCYNKRSRRAMEQALRSGNFAALGGDDQVPMTSVEAPPPDAYEAPDESHQTRLPTHGVKVVPVKMYDPKAGIDVATGQVGGGKQRSKHQITQLMVSAAALEMKRARGMGGSDAGTTHRADAKRKYGW